MRNCSFSTADSIKLATVVECDAEDNFAFAFTGVDVLQYQDFLVTVVLLVHLYQIAEEF